MNLLDSDGTGFKNIKILSSILVVVGTLGLFTTLTVDSMTKTITICDDNFTTKVKTINKTVKEVLEQNKIQFSEKDYVEPGIDAVLADGTKITVRRGLPINIMVDGKQNNIFTKSETVEQVLDEQKIVLNEKDKLNIDPATRVVKDLFLKITRVKEEVISEREPVAFKVVERKTTQVSRGARRTVKEGTDGQKEKVYKVVYEDGNIVDKKLISEKVISKPTNSVVEVGVEPAVVVTRGESLRYSNVLVMQASAYTAGYESTRKRPGDRGYGRTATGMTAQRGVVAVDPNVIPLGTKLFIESMDRAQSYGYAVAADKGSAIKGNKIDLFYEDLSDAKGFGRRNVRVYILAE